MIIGHSLLDIDTLDSNLVVNSSIQAVYVYLEPSILSLIEGPFVKLCLTENVMRIHTGILVRLWDMIM